MTGLKRFTCHMFVPVLNITVILNPYTCVCTQCTHARTHDSRTKSNVRLKTGAQRVTSSCVKMLNYSNY